MQLTKFYPYKIAVLSRDISLAVSSVYKNKYDLNRQEWRILAALGECGDMSSKEIAEFSTLEKMQVSRAIKTLTEKKLVTITHSTKDKRQKCIALSRHGKKAYANIIPSIRQKEEKILACLSDAERKQLDDFITRLQRQATRMQQTD